jgi:nucleoside-diphosphate-sugar epimerase
VATILVAGATGFVGRALTRKLLAEGHALRLLVRGPDPEERARAEFGTGVAVVAADLRDPSSLTAAPRGCDAVVNLAAVVDPREQGDEPLLRRVNRDAAIALARAARGAGVGTYVFTSSIAAMGFRPGRATPDTPCRPETSYGRAKLEAERGLAQLAAPGFRVVILRPPTVYGPGERYNFLSWVRAVDAGLFRIIGSGSNTFPLCETGNLVRAIVAAAEGRVRGGTFLVADAEEYSLSRIHAAILAALGKRAPRTRIPRLLASALGAMNELVAPFGIPLRLSRSRVRTLTADQPFDVAPLLAAGVALDAPLETAVAATIADYRTHGLLGRAAGARV